tara:strand:+ start:354 stop:653 length:300 start_codon:yes stop_codon:yes gene_type:complete
MIGQNGRMDAQFKNHIPNTLRIFIKWEMLQLRSKSRIDQSSSLEIRREVVGLECADGRVEISDELTSSDVIYIEGSVEVAAVVEEDCVAYSVLCQSIKL